MGWRFVKQPNGKLARFSDIVDHFTHYNMTVGEAIDYCLREGMNGHQAQIKVQAGVDDHKPWTTVPGEGNERWLDSLDTIEVIHGKKERSEVEDLLTTSTEYGIL